MTDQQQTSVSPADFPDGVILIDGEPHMADGRGAKVPLRLIKETDQIIDQTVRSIMGHAINLSEQVARFKGHTFDDIGALEAILAEKYGAKLGGAKGNMTLMTHDTLFKVTVQVSDFVEFGPEMQVAKSLIDECLNEWSAGSRDEIRAIVTSAFNTDKEGQINRREVFMLLRLEITDPRWKQAMAAIHDAMRVVGSKTYIRCYQRAALDAPWMAVSIDLARA